MSSQTSVNFLQVAQFFFIDLNTAQHSLEKHLHSIHEHGTAETSLKIFDPVHVITQNCICLFITAQALSKFNPRLTKFVDIIETNLLSIMSSHKDLVDYQCTISDKDISHSSFNINAFHDLGSRFATASGNLLTALIKFKEHDRCRTLHTIPTVTVSNQASVNLLKVLQSRILLEMGQTTKLITQVDKAARRLAARTIDNNLTIREFLDTPRSIERSLLLFYRNDPTIMDGIVTSMSLSETDDPYCKIDF